MSSTLLSVHAGTLARLALSLPEAHAGIAMRVPLPSGTREWSYADLGRQSAELARGLMALGVEPGDRVAILGATRPEWTVADLAALAAGAVVVPIYQTSSAPEAEYILRHSGASVAICETSAHTALVEAARAGCPALEHVFTIDGDGTTAGLRDLASLAAAVSPAELARRAEAVRPGDLATLVYTSGTTGPPKGCRLTHANLLATMEMYEERLDLHGEATVFLFLPLAHVLARVTQLVTLDVGGTLAYWSRDPDVLLDDIAAAAPTHVPSVPRLFEKIHTRALSSVADSSRVKKLVFEWALSTGRRGGGGLRHRLADRLVLSKVRALFGPELQLALTGAAPIATDVLEFFDACGVLVLEGYGMTETCAAATLNTEREHRFGSVGRPLPGTEVRIAADGEILLRGPNVFEGYHDNPEATAASFDGDWLLTGDLGSVDDSGYLRITGRKKDLIITSSGKNVSPSNIEAALRESRWISQAVVAGDNRPYLVALLTLDAEEAPALAAQLGIAPDLVSMASDPRVREVLQEDVDAVNAQFARIEQIKRFTVLGRDLTLEEDELTPTLKVKRQVVAQHFGEEIDALYR